MITATDVAIAVHIIDSSGAVDTMLKGFNRSNRGRKTNPDHYRLLLIGMLLNIQSRGSSIITDVYETLTERIPYDLQFELRVRWWEVDEDGDEYLEVLRIHDLNNAIHAIRSKLNYGKSTDGTIDDDERIRRRDVMRAITDALLGVFDLGWTSTSYAMDATGIWSWGRGHARKKAKAALKAAAAARAADEEAEAQEAA